MKLSVAFTFVAVTVTSSCATASVDDNHHESTIVLRHNALPCNDALCNDDNAPVCGFDNKTYPNACIFQATNCRTVTIAHLGPCRDKFVDNQPVHSSASATSLNEKTPLIRDRTHSANEERAMSEIAEHIAENGIKPFDRSLVDKVKGFDQWAITSDFLLNNGVHPSTYLQVIYDKYVTIDAKILGILKYYWKLTTSRRRSLNRNEQRASKLIFGLDKESKNLYLDYLNKYQTARGIIAPKS
ncbi:putative Kazal domain-containing protein [Plasmopara halstedii]